MAEVVPLLQANILLNQVLHRDKAGSPNIYQSYSALQHTWGDSVDELNAAIAASSSSSTAASVSADGEGGGVGGGAGSYRGLLLVASDVVYDPAGYRPLVTSISALLLHHQALYAEEEALLLRQDTQDTQGDSSSPQPPLMVLAHRHRNPENIKWVPYCSYCFHFFAMRLTLHL